MDVLTIYKMLYKYAKGSIILMILCGVLTLLGLFSQLLMPYSNKVLTDGVFLEGSLSQLWLAVLLFGLSATGYLFFSQGNHILFTKVEEKVLLKLKLDIHKKFRSIKEIDQHDLGAKTSYYTNDANLVKETYRAIVNLLLGFLQLIIIFFIMLFIDWRFSIIMLILIPIFAIWPRLMRNGIHKRSVTVQETEQKMLSGITDSLRLSKEIRLFNKEEWDMNNMQRSFSSIIRPKILLQVWHALMSFNQLFYWVILCTLMFFGGRMVLENEVSAGTLIALINYLGFVNEPVHSIIGNYSKLQTTKGAVDRLQKLFELENRTEGTHQLAVSNHKIELNNVSYARNGKTILTDISFKIDEGEFVGIIGRSGSGKSSILKLLSRLEEPTTGAVKVDGVNLQDIKCSSYYDNVCLITQENHFFKGTIRDNLLFGDRYTNEELTAALQGVSLLEAIMKLPDQLDSDIGEDGNNLSGGQKQRLAIIRALLKNTPILLLDEVTSALDINTEREVMDYIKRFRQGKTTIVVTHRIHTIQDADWIMILEDGEFKRKATYEQLLLMPDYLDLKADQLKGAN